MNERKLMRFYKVDEDENFAKVECAEDGDRILLPPSKNGYWLQLSTYKHYTRWAVIKDNPDGTNNEGDYKWIAS